MKTLRLFLVISCLIEILATPAILHAAKADGPKARLFAKYDKNRNGVIDGDEIEALRNDYAADPSGPLKRFDKNKDGKLDDEEIAAIKPPGSKHKGKKEDSEKSAE